MKLFLDDKRKHPDGWILVKSAERAIQLLKKGVVTEISLDHDLGRRKSGYDVVLWMEQEIAKKGFAPPANIIIHTANPVGRAKMEQAVESIRKRMEN